ncbi:termination factor Rho [Pseudomonas argentinensis]|uniref:Rho termination factor, N-terminal domain n=1 Tax=Phytopseudomonas argentinensis TaxID=289370 RepID=A0A1I3GRH7_9GAMM|nr:Rho termination factor N-terminal domain-containing protein [Pseudomonas argentinensis]KAB0548949.1 termination factor Rho [Pseudomonas argentinensis]SFI25942.1 Rho termination factor, N-terminal domain [Pseudomonas argentinensis]
MPRGSKDKYTEAQKRKAAAIESSYEERGVSEEQARARAWATVNKQSGGGERAGGSGRQTSQAQKAGARKDSARQAAASRRGEAHPDRPLEEHSKQELLHLARARQISGRSTMRKAQLISALKKAS